MNERPTTTNNSKKYKCKKKYKQKNTAYEKNVYNPCEKQFSSKYFLTYYIIPQPAAGEIMTY